MAPGRETNCLLFIFKIYRKIHRECISRVSRNLKIEKSIIRHQTASYLASFFFFRSEQMGYLVILSDPFFSKIQGHLDFKIRFSTLPLM